MPNLIGNRIVLREYRKEDLLYMRQWVNDPDIVDMLSDVFLFPQTMNKTEQFLNAMLEGSADARGFVISLRETLEYIGQIDLHRIDWKNRSAELGIVIGNKLLQGLGYGTEAMLLLQQFAFERLQLNRLELEVLAYNEPAINCYMKCGFQEEGRKRQRHYYKGEYHDVIVMSVLRSEYVPKRSE
ncbi:GNAT family N-acetyltransferase [Paenibacillus sp. MMS18-CY102]|uniref:GNAT family N-acetyltransferase n=1 Tax=Paenibacillus sp. MMS18-CY102 TaxID=2682849 RepID=UPI00136679FB|nr:GNAT family protein [Paenibacillus sp. MMS18-CY102]MWC29337.1 GNAT family N-acetyltransferase [Paenibacillus sp. MMS18-CY102]